MLSEPDILVKLNADAERFRERLAETVQAFADFAEAVAMGSLDTAERWVAGLPRIHYADHLTGQETDDA